MSLFARGLVRHFPDPAGVIRAVDGVSLDVADGELVTLLGPSGCGKTTVLRILAGFETADAGEVEIDGRSVLPLPPHLRPTALVFQNYALFPHLSVFENIAYGLKLRKLARAEIEAKVKKVMAVTRLGDLAERSPSQLSGGQQQRVALARALVIEPQVLLLDEPLSNLDAKLRQEMRLEIRRIHQELRLTSVYVTHDQEEAMSISDRIVILKDGKIQQQGTAESIYRRPQNRFVAEFMGRANFLEGEVERADADAVEVVCRGKTFRIAGQPLFSAGEKICLLVRPESVRLSAEGEGDFSGVIETVAYLGHQVHYRVRAGENDFDVVVADPSAAERRASGEPVGLVLSRAGLHLLAAEPAG